MKRFNIKPKSAQGLSYLLVISIIFVSCQKLYDFRPHEKTAVGRNVLSFYIDGEEYTQRRAGRPLYISKYGERYLSSEKSFAAFSINDDETTTIRAFIVTPKYYALDIKLPDNTFSAGATYRPEVTFYYVYLPKIRNVRQAVYRKATITEARVDINTYYPKAESGKCDRPVLAGEFTFSGHYADSLGQTHYFKAEKGIFDVSDSPIQLLGPDYYPGTIWGGYIFPSE